MYFLTGNIDNAEIEFNKQLEMSKKLNSIEDEWMGKLHISKIMSARGKYNEAEDELYKLIELYKQIKDCSFSISDIYNCQISY